VRFTKEIKISPYENPAEGEIQAFSIWVISEVSPVKEVTATIETTRGNLTIPFELVEGDRNYGKWEGFWIVRNILWKHDNWGNLIFPLRYVVNFGATNEVGEKEQSGFPIGKVVFQKIDHNYPVEGEIQTFTVWVCAEGIGPKAISREEASPVKEVTAKIKTGKGDVTIQFKLVEGDSRYGKWEGSWIVRDILWIKPDTGWPRCTIHFQAVNEANEESYVDYYIMKREGT